MHFLWFHSLGSLPRTSEMRFYSQLPYVLKCEAPQHSCRRTFTIPSALDPKRLWITGGINDAMCSQQRAWLTCQFIFSLKEKLIICSETSCLGCRGSAGPPYAHTPNSTLPEQSRRMCLHTSPQLALPPLISLEQWLYPMQVGTSGPQPLLSGLLFEKKGKQNIKHIC